MFTSQVWGGVRLFYFESVNHVRLRDSLLKLPIYKFYMIKQKTMNKNHGLNDTLIHVYDKVKCLICVYGFYYYYYYSPPPSKSLEDAW